MPAAAEPPVPLPPGRIVHVPGRGEFLLRDSGGDGVPVLLLHGWMFSADLNWFRAYGPLQEAGYRVLAMDHRGHGRGLRTHEAFKLSDCAHDAAAVLAQIGAPPAFVVGYSMGGPIASMLARDHPERVRGIVLCATAMEWRDPRMRILWNLLALVRLLLALAPHRFWRRAFSASGFPEGPTTTWMTAELTRGSAREIAQAGHELAGYDARAWIGSLRPSAAVIVTTRDTGVPPGKQRALAAALQAPTYDVAGDHGAATEVAGAFNAALLAALRGLAETPAPARTRARAA